MEQSGGVTAKPRAVVIGAGNVAWSLTQALAGEVDWIYVCSRTSGHARELADRLGGCDRGSDTGLIPQDADLYIISVADHALPRLVEELHPVPDAVWAHTSGGVDAGVLKPLSSHYGVFYPLQTFSRGYRRDFRSVPLFIEASDTKASEVLHGLANAISDSVADADSESRCRLHIAGVMSCNFANHLWDTTARILAESGYSLDVVMPLIRETLGKLDVMTPHDAQTGPARRHDSEVIERHLNAIRDDSDREVYELLSRRIFSAYKE